MQPDDTGKSEPLTAKGLADRLKKSREGVRKAIKRLSLPFLHELGGVRYYDVDATLPILEKEMRSYHRRPTSSAT